MGDPQLQGTWYAFQAAPCSASSSTPPGASSGLTHPTEEGRTSALGHVCRAFPTGPGVQEQESSSKAASAEALLTSEPSYAIGDQGRAHQNISLKQLRPSQPAHSHITRPPDVLAFLLILAQQALAFSLMSSFPHSSHQETPPRMKGIQVELGPGTV